MKLRRLKDRLVDEEGTTTHPRNNVAQVENAVIAASCSPSKAKECENAIHDGANR